MQNLRMASNPLLKQEPFGHCSAAAGVSSDAQMPSPSVSEADINIANSNSSCVSERLQKILEVNIGICPNNPEPLNNLFVNVLEDYAPEIVEEANRRLNIASFQRSKEMTKA